MAEALNVVPKKQNSASLCSNPAAGGRGVLVSHIAREELLCARPCAGSQGPQNQDLAPTLWRTIDHWKNLADGSSSHPEYLRASPGAEL